jgi:drug/metabolite transporter (DMT)-like permease
MKNYKVYSIITIIIWAMAYILTKIGLIYYSPLGLSVFRYVAASIFFLIVIFVKKVPFPDIKDIPWFFALGATGFSIYVLTFNIGAQSVSVATSSIIIATTPIFTVLIARMIFNEKISKIGWVGILIEFIGVVVICLWEGIFSLNAGVLWILISAISFSIYNILQRKLVNKYTPMQTTTYSIFAGTIILVAFLPKVLPELKNSFWQANVSVIIMGVVCSGIAYLMWSKALALAEKTSEVSNFLFVSPLLTTLMGFFTLFEIPSIGTWLGGAIIFLGIILFEKGK